MSKFERHCDFCGYTDEAESDNFDFFQDGDVPIWEKCPVCDKQLLCWGDVSVWAMKTNEVVISEPSAEPRSEEEKIETTQRFVDKAIEVNEIGLELIRIAKEYGVLTAEDKIREAIRLVNYAIYRKDVHDNEED